MASPLEGFSVVVDIPIRWGDLDAFGHVNNTVFFQYFESARIRYFEEIGFTGASGVGPILHSTNCRFRIPLQYPGDVKAAARVTELNADRFLMEYRISLGETLAADGTGLIVAYDYKQGRKAELPADVLRKIEARDNVKVTGKERG
jgi:acyl-CoA thioester hydrolase